MQKAGILLGGCGLAAAGWAAFLLSPDADRVREDIVIVPSGPPAKFAQTMQPSALAAPNEAPDEVNAAAATCPTITRPAGYTQLYADEFNTASLNTTDWFYRIAGPYANGYIRSQNVSLAGGALRLRFGYEDVTGDGQKEFTGGGIMSRTNFGYGYYEVCAKLFAGTSGLHTSFWSMGLRRDIAGAGGDARINQDIDAGLLAENNQLYEIDGFEHDSPDKLGLGDVVQAEGTTGHRSPYASGASRGVDYGAWNVYGFEYTPTATRFYINGQLQLTIDNTTNGYAYTPQTFWLTAIRLLGSPNAGALPGYSEFDYFRYSNKAFIGANLIGNGNFDVVTKAIFQEWNPPAWIESFDKPASYITTSDKYNGTRSLIHSATSAYQVTTKQNLDHLTNGTYRLTARVKSSGGQSQALMRVVNFGGAERNVTLPTTSSWTLITIDNIAVTNGKATVAFTSTASANQWIRVDNVVFSRIS